ncbi:hypothetical protein B0I08_101333 [Glaciihabitans tibetensis]|uniref:Uncharacterized protein n=1 Tax=Glaciihabitans tibetensis TaxID=1266600 RepID=A0A2T0VJC8_9MICO|nr:hypothetical protein B0I08_101333 [Glaciihabitans tibetensis]
MSNYTNVAHQPVVGLVLGQLTVIEIDLRAAITARQVALKQLGDRSCRVRCECGLEFEIRNIRLFHATRPTRACRSCAHYAGKPLRPAVGDRFEKLTVTAVGGFLPYAGLDLPAVDLLCDCGNTISVATRYLRETRFCSPACPLHNMGLAAYPLGSKVGHRVVEETGLKFKSGTSAVSLRCECGSLALARTSNLAALDARNTRCKKCAPRYKGPMEKLPALTPEFPLSQGTAPRRGTV